MFKLAPQNIARRSRLMSRPAHESTRKRSYTNEVNKNIFSVSSFSGLEASTGRKNEGRVRAENRTCVMLLRGLCLQMYMYRTAGKLRMEQMEEHWTM